MIDSEYYESVGKFPEWCEAFAWLREYLANSETQTCLATMSIEAFYTNPVGLYDMISFMDEPDLTPEEMCEKFFLETLVRNDERLNIWILTREMDVEVMLPGVYIPLTVVYMLYEE